MQEIKNQNFTVKLSKIINDLKLEEVYTPQRDILIETVDVNRPGLQIAGFFDYFDPKRIQIFGMVEKTYLEEFSSEEKIKKLDAFFGTGIPVLIIYSKYKKMQTLGKRKALLVLTILLTIFTGFQLFSVISSIGTIAMLNSGEFTEIFDFLMEAGEVEISGDDLEIFNSIFGSITDFAVIVFWVSFILDAIILAFGVIGVIFGFKAITNKEWTAAATNANNSVNAYGYGAPAYTEIKVCTVCGNSATANEYTCSRCGSTTFQPADYPQQAPQAPVQQNNAPQYEWYCPSCGTANSAEANFCKNCATRNPNLQ
ncbi:MAG: hypothetical protein J6Q67_00435 [Clostridia bacterium]|nr:hypothetical protein [Clostridia bacterium]